MTIISIDVKHSGYVLSNQEPFSVKVQLAWASPSLITLWVSHTLKGLFFLSSLHIKWVVFITRSTHGDSGFLPSASSLFTPIDRTTPHSPYTHFPHSCSHSKLSMVAVYIIHWTIHSQRLPMHWKLVSLYKYEETVLKRC